MRWLVTGAVVATLAAAAAASAQGTPSNVDVAWSAPLECPSRAAVLGEVRAILEGGAKTGPQSPPPPASTPHPVDARAVVTRTGQGWHVELAIRSDQGSGERSLDADSCAELASAVALIVALAVDPTRRAAPPPVADAAPAVEDAAPPAPDAGPPAPPTRAEEAEADGPRIAFGAAGAADFGALPAAAVGGAVSVAGLYRRARLDARGRIFASQRTGDPSRPAQGVDLSYLGFDARACFAVVATGRAARDGVAISPCLGVDVSRLSGNGFAGQTGQKTLSGNGVWLGAEGGLLGTWALGSIVALRVGVDLLVPTSRPAFVVLAPDGTTAASLHRPAPVGGRVDLGAELRFW